MVLINKAINEVTVKLVYYGPGLCGKTTNLEKIYANPKLDNKGKMISMATETDRTLFFDFMPMELGTVGGQKVRVQLYTVPGQVFYDATRKLVLRGADGVVFVADSQKTMRDSNLDSLNNLKTNLRINRLDPDKIALVFQYNKRDLPNADSIEEMSEYLKPNGAPVIEASAKNGTGVTATLRAAVSRILENLKNKVDTTLHEAPELTAPDMTQKAGVTAGSAGTPKVAMKADPAAMPKSTIAQSQAVPIPEPEPVTEEPQEESPELEVAAPPPPADDEPFDGFAPVEEPEPALDSPFAAEPVSESPFAASEPEAEAASPFAPEAATEEHFSPFAAEEAVEDLPFAEPSADQPFDPEGTVAVAGLAFRPPDVDADLAFDQAPMQSVEIPFAPEEPAFEEAALEFDAGAAEFDTGTPEFDAGAIEPAPEEPVIAGGVSEAAVPGEPMLRATGREELESMLQGAQHVVRSLEDALEIARAHERLISDELARLR